MDYTLIRSGRKSVGFEIGENGLTVRAPYSVSAAEIDRLVTEKQAWIEKSLARMKRRSEEAEHIVPLTWEELDFLAGKAREYIPERAEYYARLIGVKYGRITIRSQHTRWGSCSSGGNLNFNCLLMLAPADVIDSVVVHELCHIKEMNHSPAFYSEVVRVFPGYKECSAWLKKNGYLILRRLPVPGGKK